MAFEMSVQFPVARAAAIQRLGKIRGARRHDDAAKLFTDALAEESFLTSQRNRRLEKTVRKMLDFFFAAGDADVSFHQIVVRLKVLVGEWPVFPVAIL